VGWLPVKCLDKRMYVILASASSVTAKVM